MAGGEGEKVLEVKVDAVPVKELAEQLAAFSAALTELIRYVEAAHERQVRIESMLIYSLETQREEVITQPTTEQAKQLVALGLPPWPKIKMVTNRYAMWKQGFEQKLAEKEATRAEG